MYARGDGVEKDREAAVVWLRKAADQGSPRARQFLERLTGSSTAAL
jgi:TPR repeat protein